MYNESLIFFCSQSYFMELFIDNSFELSHISKVFLNNWCLAFLAALYFVMWDCAEHRLVFSVPVLCHSHWSMKDAFTRFQMLLGGGMILLLGESIVKFKITLCILENMSIFSTLLTVL